MPSNTSNRVGSKHVPSHSRGLKKDVPVQGRQQQQRIQQEYPLAQWKDRQSHSFWSFASMTFAFANHIWHHASPELRRKVEDFAKPSRGLLTFIQDGPQTSINAKHRDAEAGEGVPQVTTPGSCSTRARSSAFLYR
ncbi:hypothetical protein BDQ94DRAFT_176732 [Aspergillus welwitschiae]|uniref:Uncharacterized protein n=1 Tax=Aspergillus welwitschiae TaxID=1341132 RepID=A0A3F3PH10_9EURO|nr:hypothetical protein BDQ94DRAFT_176732 [Aspergillus welwitschiae]RDH26107.1 hypothetical protein BDQ94DRAFT_176732 [Aspergillus welwitschiae]